MRRARTVRLQAADRDLVRRGVILLEDALRTATIDEPVGRLVLVRRLNIGTIQPDRSSARLALQIEQAMQRVRPVAVVADAAVSSSTDAVFFQDRVHAIAVATIRIARSIPLSEWFWPSAIPEIRRLAEAADPLAVAIRLALAELPEQAAPAAATKRSFVIGFLHELHKAAVLGVLLRRFTPVAAAEILTEIGVSITPASADVPSRADGNAFARESSENPTDHIALQTAFPEVRHWTHDDPRIVLLSTIMTPVTGEERRAAATRSRSSRPIPEPTDQRRAITRTTEHAHQPRRAEETVARLEDTQPPAVARVALNFDEAVATSAGGALFLLPVLRRLFPALYQSEVVTDILEAACRRAGIPEADPMRASILIPSGMWPFDRSVLRHCEKWLKRRARLTLRTLIHRPSRVLVSRTHIEVVFHHKQADIRVRRAGLDVDPGWVPGLGRIVLYHYQYEELDPCRPGA